MNFSSALIAFPSLYMTVQGELIKCHRAHGSFNPTLHFRPIHRLFHHTISPSMICPTHDIDDFRLGDSPPEAKFRFDEFVDIRYPRTVLRAPRARNRTYYLFTRSLSRKSSWDGRLKLGAEQRELRSYGR